MDKLAGNKLQKAIKLFKQRKFSEALTVFDAIVSISGDNAETLSYQADCYRNLGKFNQAVPVYNKLLNISPKNQQAKINLFLCLKQSLPSKYTKALENDVLCYLSFENANFNDLSNYVSELISLKYQLASGTKQIELSEVAQDRLLKLAMHKLILSNEYVEMFLTGIRAALLQRMMESTQIDIQEVDLAVAISMQQFLCEYTYLDTELEQQSISQLILFLDKASNIETTAIDSILAPIILISMYCPLNSLPASKTLTTVPLEHWPEIIRGIIIYQILIPQKELQYENKITQLGQIENSISNAVQQQYEQNPYPRWQTASFNLSDNYVKDITNAIPHFNPPNNLTNNKLQILVAGCGTGKQLVELAKSYPSSSILAVDLSRRSLAYATLKTEHYGITNVEFLQADILDLDKLDRQFDVIESIGVLHHMAEPKLGFEILNRLLKPAGFLKIGLYSQLARQSISKARDLLKENAIETTNQNIRLFRKSVMLGEYGEPIRDLACSSIDFFSLSGCRDLFFHVQEHQFSCQQIEKILSELKLDFIGFCQVSSQISQEYRKLAPDSKSMASLKLWHKAEQKHPNSFGQMYQFWCQKH